MKAEADHRCAAVPAKEAARKVTIAGNDVHGTMKNPDGGLHTTIPLGYPAIYDLLKAKNVDVTIKDTSSGTWVSILLQASPFIVLAAFWTHIESRLAVSRLRPSPAS